MKRNRIFPTVLALGLALSLAPMNMLPVQAQQTGSFTLHKLTREGGTDIPPNEDGGAHESPEELAGYLPVAGIGYTITRTAEYSLDDDGNVLDVTATSFSETHFTDEEGLISLTDLPAGRYTFQEFAPEAYTDGRTMPAGVSANTVEYTFEIPMASMTAEGEPTYNFDIHAYPKSAADNADFSFTVYGRNARTGQDTPLSGAVFQLYDSAGELVSVNAQGLAIGETINGCPHAFQSGTDGQVSLEHLDSRKSYELRQAAPPDNWLPEAELYTFIAGETVYEAGTHDVINTQPVKTVSGTTADAEVLPGQTYTYTVYVTIPRDMDDLDTYTIEDTLTTGGLIDISSLDMKAGDVALTSCFTVSQAGGPNHFSAVTSEAARNTLSAYAGQTLTISYEANVADGMTAQIVNEVVETLNSYTASAAAEVKTVYGSIRLNKTDVETKEPLEGAVFELQKKDQAGSFITYTYPGTGRGSSSQTTDENGSILWQNLPAGDYRVVETRAPAHGDSSYIITQKETLVDELSLDALDQTVNVTNRQPKWYLPSTGGRGPAGFYLVGAGLLLAAFVLLMLTRRKRHA